MSRSDKGMPGKRLALERAQMYKVRMIRLLVSVRSLAEASTCIHNGADIVDIKEPGRGSLGMSSLQTISAIAREVPPRFPVSAALGEWTDWRREGRFPTVPEGLAYLKIGLAGARQVEGWREDFGRFCREVCARAQIYSEPSWVAVAYADWERARAPRPSEVLDFACANGFPVLLLDTWKKDGASLFDCMEPERVQELLLSARIRGLDVGLAGSLRLREIEMVISLAPDVLAVRSAACHGGNREAAIDAGAVREVARAIAAVSDAVGVSA
jgi:uncharacterized protein (UPF0264 family)